MAFMLNSAIFQKKRGLMKITIKKIPKDFRPETKKHTFRLTEKESKRLTKLADAYYGGVKTDLLKLLINNAVFEGEGFDYSELLRLAIEIKEKKGHDVFIDYSPHVDSIHYQIFLNGWNFRTKNEAFKYGFIYIGELEDKKKTTELFKLLRGLL